MNSMRLDAGRRCNGAPISWPMNFIACCRAETGALSRNCCSSDSGSASTAIDLKCMPADNCQSIAWWITMITGLMYRFAVRPAGRQSRQQYAVQCR
jgi:hypothetical protein